MDHLLHIRKASSQDIPVIRKLAMEIWPDTYGHILTADALEYMLDLIYSPSSLLHQLQNQAHTFLLASQDHEPIGFASFSETGDANVYKLHKLYVHQKTQGKGFGKAFLADIETRVRTLGAGTLRLNVNRHNKARQFYEGLGFSVVREEDVDIGKGYFMNDFVMEKPLR